MKIEELAQLQPVLFERFEHILQQHRLNHAYLFTGAFGSFEMAQCLAQSLFCTNKNGVFPCGECRNCRLIEEEDFSDVTVVRPVNQIIKTERVRELVRRKETAYLQVAKLASLADDKEKQEQVLKLLELLFAKEMQTTWGRFYLEGIFTARKMWQANVSFQNALEYMVLHERE